MVTPLDTRNQIAKPDFEQVIVFSTFTAFLILVVFVLTALPCAGVNLIVLALFPLRDNYPPVHIQRQRGEYSVAPG